MSKHKALAGVVLCAALATGCADLIRLEPAVPPSPNGPGQVDPKLADAVRFRTSFGLRSDEGWIRAVAADPTASMAYGVPLTPAEKADIDARATNSDAVVPIIQRYGLGKPGEWGGVFIDQQAGGAVVGLFTGHPAEHEAALRTLLNPNAKWEIRGVRRTLMQLEAIRAQVESRIMADEAWLRSIHAWFAGIGVDLVGNVVQLDISSKNPLAAGLVAERLGGDGWLRVLSDGIGRWEGPVGVLVVRALMPDGKPYRGESLDCVPLPVDPAAFSSGDMAWGTNDRGECRFPGVGAAEFEVQLKRMVVNEWVVVGRGRVIVPPNGEGIVRIVVQP